MDHYSLLQSDSSSSTLSPVSESPDGSMLQKTDMTDERRFVVRSKAERDRRFVLFFALVVIALLAFSVLTIFLWIAGPVMLTSLRGFDHPTTQPSQPPIPPPPPIQSDLTHVAPIPLQKTIPVTYGTPGPCTEKYVVSKDEYFIHAVARNLGRTRDELRIAKKIGVSPFTALNEGDVLYVPKSTPACNGNPPRQKSRHHLLALLPATPSSYPADPPTPELSAQTIAVTSAETDPADSIWNLPVTTTQLPVAMALSNSLLTDAAQTDAPASFTAVSNNGGQCSVAQDAGIIFPVFTADPYTLNPPFGQ
jgi:hypothetical protein